MRAGFGILARALGAEPTKLIPTVILTCPREGLDPLNGHRLEARSYVR
jgi:hypothetical protein